MAASAVGLELGGPTPRRLSKLKPANAAPSCSHATAIAIDIAIATATRHRQKQPKRRRRRKRLRCRWPTRRRRRGLGACPDWSCSATRAVHVERSHSHRPNCRHVLRSRRSPGVARWQCCGSSHSSGPPPPPQVSESDPQSIQKLST